jgi:Flp pilus assembly protein TadG
MLRCRRGSAAFATVVALVPLIGVVALGAEAGSWYVVKQHEQNAADSAAMSGALAIANSDTQANFGTLNGFSPNVTVTQGSYSPGSGFSPGGTPLNAVHAVVTECQPQSLSLVLYKGSCNGTPNNVLIKSEAVASVEALTKVPCVLAAAGPITFQDAAVQINAPNCGIASNGTPVGINFKVAPKTFNVGSVSTAGSCTGSYCNSVSPPVNTYAPPVKDQFSDLVTAINGLTLNPCGSTLQPYAPTATTPGLCANDNQTFNKVQSITMSGVYFFSGGLSLGGNGGLRTCTGLATDPDPVCTTPAQLNLGPITATIIVLPVNKPPALKMAGGSVFNITAPNTAPSTLPGALSSVANLLANMAIFDPETSPQITGTSTFGGSGVFYLPNANPLNFQGTSNGVVSTCTEVIAASIQFSGTPSFDNSGCPDSIKLKSYIVVLVQ